MIQEKIDRINILARKAKTAEGLTEQEKADHPEHKTTGGYLKTLDEADAAQTWWDGLDQCKRDIILNLPNFDADIFFKCTGINVKGEDNA